MFSRDVYQLTYAVKAPKGKTKFTSMNINAFMSFMFLYYILPLLAISFVFLSLSTPMLMIYNLTPSLIPDLQVVVNVYVLARLSFVLMSLMSEWFKIRFVKTRTSLSSFLLLIEMFLLLFPTLVWSKANCPFIDLHLSVTYDNSLTTYC